MFILIYIVTVVEAFLAVVVFSISSTAMARPTLDKNRMLPVSHRGLKVFMGATAITAFVEMIALVI